MIPGSFVAAMRAHIAIAPYEAPFRSAADRTEWILVSRWGVDGQHLTIAQTGVAAPGDAGTPDGLQPKATFFGVLAWEEPGDGASVFLLVRRLPAQISVAGIFLPTDGFARISGDPGSLRLSAGGRYAHLAGMEAGHEVRGDVPCPPPGAHGAESWRFEAEQVRWMGELFGGFGN